jgi:enamine deaminase RidA (YjgF/YER057c/UK114 family)
VERIIVNADQRLAELGVALPTPPAPLAAYVGFVRVGNLVTTAGQLPTMDGKLLYGGKVGTDVSEAEAKRAARLCCINALAQLKAAAGSLAAISRIVRLDGYVASADGFTNQPAVLNGASEFLLEVFGEAGRHARAAVGVAELPLGAAVELVLWAEVAAD